MKILFILMEHNFFNYFIQKVILMTKIHALLLL